jgi:hypothetical protein
MHEQQETNNDPGYLEKPWSAAVKAIIVEFV